MSTDIDRSGGGFERHLDKSRSWTLASEIDALGKSAWSGFQRCLRDQIKEGDQTDGRK